MSNLINAVPGVAQTKLAIRGIITAGLLITIISVGLYIWGLNNTIDSLTLDKKHLTADNKQLQINVDTVKNNFSVCQTANIAQQLSIDSLLKERDDNIAAVNSLAVTEQKNENTILGLKKKLAALNADSANNGPLANNLKETIRSIQNKENIQ